MTQTAQHLPGPWIVEEHPDEFPRQIVISTDNGRIIAGCDDNDEQDKPTAYLIAAAPDSLEALIDLVKKVEAHPGINRECSPLCLARAAIVKATEVSP